MPLYKWSQTSASNANADPTINWAEGQAPSSVNDSARAMMSATAKWRDDVSGAIVTGGTATAYTVASNQSFDSLALLNGQIIAFTPHATNTGAVTLNVDGLGAKYLRASSAADLPAGTLIAGTPYVAIYNNSDAAFYLHGFYGNPYGIPLGGGLDYWGDTAPNSLFAFPYGQALSRTTYATLFSILGTTYGTGDGSTTFNIPDKRGRASFGKDNMGGSGAGRVRSDLSGITGTTLGAAGGSEVHTLTNAQLPSITPSFTGTSTTVNVSSTTSNVVQAPTVQDVGINNGAFTYSLMIGGARGGISSTGSFTPIGTVSGFGSGSFHNNMPPAIVCNYIIRVL